PDGPSGELPAKPFYLPLGMSANGRYVVFTSWASNLVAGETGAILPRVFVRDLVARVTTAVVDGEFAAISGDGRHVAYLSGSPGGYAELYLRDLASGETTDASRGDGGTPPDGPVPAAAISADGRHVAFS